MNRFYLLSIQVFLGALPFFLLINSNLSNDVIKEIRIPTYLSALSTGSLLALIGVSFQRIFRNDLAGPYTLGVSSASSLGILIASLLGITSWWIGSIFGVILSVLILLVIIRVLKDKSSNTLILAGICLNIFLGGLLILLLFLDQNLDLINFIRWTMGNVQVFGINLALPTILLSILVLINHFTKNQQYDAILLGDDIALVSGKLSLNFYSWEIIILSLALGVCISIHGPVSFVGFVIPHLVKRFKLLNFNQPIRDFKNLSYLAFSWGGLFLLYCEYLSIILPTPFKLPVGVITTVCGSFLMIFVLVIEEKGKI